MCDVHDLFVAVYRTVTRPGAKTIKKNTNSTQNKSETHRAKQYEVTSFLSTVCELSTETCSKNVYRLGPCSDDWEPTGHRGRLNKIEMRMLKWMMGINRIRRTG